MRVAKFLGWKEFVVAFIVMSFASSLPNLLVGIFSIFHRIPILSFGDVVGGNVVDLTLAIAISALIAKGLPTDSRTVQSSSIFTLVVAVLPLFLILDGTLGRVDGLILILIFVAYNIWLFSKKERFTKDCEEEDFSRIKEFKPFLRDIGYILLGWFVLLLSAEGIVLSSKFFAYTWRWDLALIGILIVGLGNALPEIYFSISLARKCETWMILGNLMGCVIVPATLVLGLVALLSPIKIPDFSPFVIARFFLIISALFFFFFVKSDKKISKTEALVLLFIYIAFVVSEIVF